MAEKHGSKYQTWEQEQLTTHISNHKQKTQEEKVDSI